MSRSTCLVVVDDDKLERSQDFPDGDKLLNGQGEGGGGSTYFSVTVSQKQNENISTHTHINQWNFLLEKPVASLLNCRKTGVSGRITGEDGALLILHFIVTKIRLGSTPGDAGACNEGHVRYHPPTSSLQRSIQKTSLTGNF